MCERVFLETKGNEDSERKRIFFLLAFVVERVKRNALFAEENHLEEKFKNIPSFLRILDPSPPRSPGKNSFQMISGSSLRVSSSRPLVNTQHQNILIIGMIQFFGGDM